MTNPTSNYGFVLPTSSDLVTDLPADFDVALQGVDTRLKALQPGTTLGDIAYSSATANTNTRLPIGTSGQVLAVSGGGVPEWTTTADVTPLTTKGDLFTYTTADARLGVGTDGQTLVADSTASTGLKWATPASGSTFVGARVYNSAQQSIPNNTNTLLTFDSELWDTDTYHSTSSNTGRFTIPAGKAGYYSVYCQTSIGNNATGWRQFMLYKNGTLFGQGGVIAAAANYVSPYMNVTVNLAVADYIEFYAFQDSGGALNCDTRNGVYSYFGINYLGA